MALARPGTLAPRPPAPLLLQLLLLSPALALLGGELGHKPWGVGGWGSVSQSRHARPRGSLCGCQDGLQGWAQAKMWVQRGALLPELAWKRVRPGTLLLCGVVGGLCEGILGWAVRLGRGAGAGKSWAVSVGGCR